MKKITAIVAALVLSLGLTAMPVARAEQPLDTIEITGTASRTVDPDMATVNFSYEHKGATVEEARQAGAQVSNKFLHTMLAAGIDRSDIATVSYNVYPNYRYERNGKQILDGYRINAGWSVKVKNLEKLGSIIDQGLAAGANSLNGVSFGLQNEDLIKRQLLSEAVENAKYTAQAVANAGGRGLGVLRQASIPSSSVVTARPLMMAKMARADMAEAVNEETELAPKAMTVTVRVNTLFALTLEE